MRNKYRIFRSPLRNQIFTIGLIVLIYIVLGDTIKELFNNFVVKFFLSKFSTTPLSLIYITLYIALLFLLCTSLYETVIKKAYKITPISLFSIFFIIFLYYNESIYSRTSTLPKRYCFYPLCKLGNLEVYQLDPLFFTLIIIGTALFINYFRFKTYRENATFLFQDIPITKIELDKYKRKEFFRKLIIEIKKISFDSSRGFAIGINSSWGFGKSSLLKIIKTGLEDEKDIICLEYNPWLAINKKSLTYDFFLLIENELSKHIETSNLISKYGEKLSKIDDERNPLKRFTDLFSHDKSLQKRFTEIGKLIRKTNKRFFIIIDDLDRLDNSEVIEVLKLIRNTGNFPRMNFIVAYDKNYLINALRVKKIYNSSSYIEKIFDLEIILPKIESSIILEELNLVVKGGLEKIPLEEQELKDFVEQIATIIFNSNNLQSPKILNTKKTLLGVFKNKRDILKFSNSMLLLLAINKDRIYLPDLFILELIKLIDYKTYELLIKNNNYLDIINDNGIRIYKLHGTDLKGLNDSDSTVNMFREDLYNIRDKIEDSTIKALISALFDQPALEDYNSRNAISFVDNLEGYFIYSLPNGNVGFSEVDNLIHGDDE